MATYKKFSELPEITEASEYTKVPVLDGNEMKLLNGAKLGGDAGVKTAIIKDSNYDRIIAGGEDSEDVTYTCTNMTYEEVYEIMASGKPLTAIAMLSCGDGVQCLLCAPIYSIKEFDIPCIIIPTLGAVTLFWTADGFSTIPPSSGGGES